MRPRTKTRKPATHKRGQAAPGAKHTKKPNRFMVRSPVIVSKTSTKKPTKGKK